MEADQVPARTVLGTVRLARIGRFRFPVAELRGEAGTLARLGRDGSLRIFFGPGRRVQLADGTEWHIKAASSGKHIVPILKAGQSTIAVTGPLPARRSYGINARGAAYTLIPDGRRGRWVVRNREIPVASLTESPRQLQATEPIPLPVVVLALALVTHGIPGEADLMPARD